MQPTQDGCTNVSASHLGLHLGEVQPPANGSSVSSYNI